MLSLDISGTIHKWQLNKDNLGILQDDIGDKKESTKIIYNNSGSLVSYSYPVIAGAYLFIQTFNSKEPPLAVNHNFERVPKFRFSHDSNWLVTFDHYKRHWSFYRLQGLKKWYGKEFKQYKKDNILVWDVRSGQIKFELEIPFTTHFIYITDIIFLSDQIMMAYVLEWRHNNDYHDQMGPFPHSFYRVSHLVYLFDVTAGVYINHKILNATYTTYLKPISCAFGQNSNMIISEDRKEKPIIFGNYYFSNEININYFNLDKFEIENQKKIMNGEALCSDKLVVSPDGQWIAFRKLSSNNLAVLGLESPSMGVVGETDYSLVLKKISNINNTIILDAKKFMVRYYFAFSPDSQWLAFSIRRGGIFGINSVTTSINVINVNNQGDLIKHEIDDLPNACSALAWHPDGQIITAIFKEQLYHFLFDASIPNLRLLKVPPSSSLKLTNMAFQGATGVSEPICRLLHSQSASGIPSKKNSEDQLYFRSKAQIYTGAPSESLFLTEDASHLLTPDGYWTVAFIRDKKSPEHAFLLLESIVDNYYRIQRFDFYIDEDRKEHLIKFKNLYLKGRAIIEVKDVKASSVKQNIASNHWIYRAWHIQAFKGKQLKKNIIKNQQKISNYLLMGNSKLYSFWQTEEERPHNCISWCVKHLSKIGIREEKLGDSLFYHPEVHLSEIPNTERFDNRNMRNH